MKPQRRFTGSRVLRWGLSAAAALVVLVQLATSAGIVAGVLGVTLGFWLAERAIDQRARALPAVVSAALVPFVGGGAGALIANHPIFLTPLVALLVSDFIAVLAVSFSLAFIVHFASERSRALALLEPALVLAAVVSSLANHRHHRIEHPRALSDWAWSHDVDPGLVFSFFGVIGALVAVVMLLREARARDALWLLLLGFLLYLLPSSVQLPPSSSASEKHDDAKDEDNKDDKDKNQKPQSTRPPDPMAILTLHDELPEDLDAIYLRQNVLSRMSGDRLVDDAVHDLDIVNRLNATPSVSPQAQAFHRKVHTSVFLLAEHSALFGPAHPYALQAIVNPNPARFVGAYDVFSYWLRVATPRLAGRAGRDAAWTEEQTKHYTAAPADPRYMTLSNRIVRDMDPRFVGDDVMAAFAIKQYLEKNGVYNSRKKTLVGSEPTASFLFGDLHGYCVHFAHAAALLLRSQGIAARVALGYAVQTRLRGAGSSILVLENQAHAWPEMFVDGVGWVTFDIHPERSDDAPSQLVDVELESMLGEMARKDPPKPKTSLNVPRYVYALPVLVFLLVCYAVKWVRRSRAASPTHVYLATLDALSDLGARRRLAETRERHAERVKALSPSFVPMTTLFLRWALGLRDAETRSKLEALAREVRADLARNTSPRARILAALNPVGWWLTR